MSEHSELAQMLRAWRDRLQPSAVGLPSAGRRRANGLRREELAALCGLSVDYLTRLEQGRATSPSAQVLAALSRSLQLTHDERDHLFRLAGQPIPRTGVIDTHIPPGLQRLLTRLDGFPFGVHDPAWNVIACNRLWQALTGTPDGEPGQPRNVARSHFFGDCSYVVMDDHERELMAETIVADLRVAQGRYPDDEQLAALIRELREASTRFATLWNSGVVSAHVANQKTFDHPEVGLLRLDCDVLTVQHSDLRIVVYTPEPDSDDAQKLDLLRVIGHDLARA